MVTTNQHALLSQTRLEFSCLSRTHQDYSQQSELLVRRLLWRPTDKRGVITINKVQSRKEV